MAKIKGVYGQGGGGKGGGGGSNGGNEAPNTARSNAIARVAIAVSEGPIGGLVDGAKSVFFDGTALQTDTGYYNYKGVWVDERVGLTVQPKLRGFSAAESLQSVNVTVEQPVPVIRTVSSADVDAARMIVSFPVLQSVDKKSGDQNGTTVQFKFDVRDNVVGVWESRGTYTVSEKNNAGFQKAYRITRPSGSAPWDIRFTRITADSESNYLQNDTVWDSYVEIQEGNFTYPDTAYYGVTIDTDQFGGNIPNISFDVDGLVVKVPSNYFEERLVSGATLPAYSGPWNGTWKMAVTSNPIWVLNDILENDRYGAGQPENYIKKFDLYEAARYCDAVDNNGLFVGVPDLAGGFRRRFTFRTQIMNQDEALKYMISIMSSCRGNVFWSAGAVSISMDRPRDADMIFGPENVMDGLFNYSTTAASERFRIVNVTYNNPDESFDAEIVQWKNPLIKDTNGVENEANITKMGCANAAEAQAYARWYGDTSITQFKTVNFRTGFDARALRPGDRFDIMDPRVAGVMRQGRVKDYTTDTVVLDKPVFLDPGHTYTFVTVDSQGQTLARKTISATSTGVTTDTLELTSVWGTKTIRDKFGNIVVDTPEVAKEHIWLISGDIEPTSWTVMHVKEQDDFIHEVMAVNYDPTKFSRVELNTPLPPPDYTKIELNQVLPPTFLEFKPFTVRDDIMGPRNDATISWVRSASPYAMGYRVAYRRNASQWVTIGSTASNSIVLERIAPGEYEIVVFAYSPTGVESLPLSGTFEWRYDSDSTDLEPPLNLRLTGLDPAISTTQDFNFAWDENPQWEDTAINVPIGFEVNVLTTDGLNVLKSLYQPFDRPFTGSFTYSENFDTGLKRSVLLQVKTVDGGGRRSPPINLVVSNPAPDALSGVTAVGGFEFVRVTHNLPTPVSDLAGTIIWASTTPGFTPGPSNKVWSGIGTFHDFEAQPNTTYYIRAAAYDIFSDNPTLLNVSAEVTATTADSAFDTPTPDTPARPNMAYSVSNGVVSLTATWTANTPETFTSYEVAISELNESSYVSGFLTGTNSYTWTSVKPNTLYYVKVRAKNATKDSPYSISRGLTSPFASGTGTQIVAVTAPTGLTASASFKSATLNWTEGTGTIVNTEIRMNTTNNATTATTVGKVTAGTTTFTVQGLNSGQIYYFWVRHLGPSSTGPVNTGTTSATTLTTVTADYGNLSIVDANILNLNGDKIVANTIDANRIKAGTILSDTIQVGGTTFSDLIDDVNDPAPKINANTTLIEPGKILISGGTLLSNWRNGTDTTKIEGGNIATNTISANSVKIGLRGLTIEGINFEANKTTARASWTAGKITYIADSGTVTTVAIAAGDTLVNATPAAPVYIWWTKGATTLSHGTDAAVANGPDNVVMAAYTGGSDIIANYGGTIIDGDKIRTGTIQANRIEANSIGSAQLTTGELIATRAQIRDGIIDNAHLQNATIETAKIKDAAVDTLKIAGNSVSIINSFDFSINIISGLTFPYVAGTSYFIDYNDAAQVGAGNVVNFNLTSLPTESNDVIMIMYLNSFLIGSSGTPYRGSVIFSMLETNRAASFVSSQFDYSMISRYNPSDTGETMINNRINSQVGNQTTVITRKTLVSGGSRIFRPVVRLSVESGSQPMQTPQIFGRVLFFRFLR